MDDLSILVFIGVFVVALAAPIVFVVRQAFRLHDPARATAAVAVEAAAPFELALAPPVLGMVCFRFEIDGDTDHPYDLLVRGEIVGASGASRPFAWRTARKSRIAGAQAATYVTSTHAVTTSSGSIELATLQASDRQVRGVVSADPAGLLKRGWIYVPP